MSLNFFAMTPLSDAAWSLILILALLFTWQCYKHSNNLDLKCANAFHSFSRFKMAGYLLLIDIIPLSYNPAFGTQESIPGPLAAFGDVVWYNGAFVGSLVGYIVCSSPGWVLYLARHIFHDLASKTASRFVEGAVERLRDGIALTDAVAAAAPLLPATAAANTKATHPKPAKTSRNSSAEVVAQVKKLQQDNATLVQEAIDRESHWATKLAVEEYDHRLTKEDARMAEDALQEHKDRLEFYEGFHEQATHAEHVDDLPPAVIHKVKQLVRAGCNTLSSERVKGPIVNSVTNVAVGVVPNPSASSTDDTMKEKGDWSHEECVSKESHDAMIAELRGQLVSKDAIIQQLESARNDLAGQVETLKDGYHAQAQAWVAETNQKAQAQLNQTQIWKQTAEERQERVELLENVITTGNAGVAKLEITIAELQVELDTARQAASEAQNKLEAAASVQNDLKAKLKEAESSVKALQREDTGPGRLHILQQSARAQRLRHGNEMKEEKDRYQALEGRYSALESRNSDLETELSTIKSDYKGKTKAADQDALKFIHEFTRTDAHVWLHWKFYENYRMGREPTQHDELIPAFNDLSRGCREFKNHCAQVLHLQDANQAATMGGTSSTSGATNPSVAGPSTPSAPGIAGAGPSSSQSGPSSSQPGPSSSQPGPSGMAASMTIPADRKRRSDEAGLNVPYAQQKPRTEDP